MPRVPQFVALLGGEVVFLCHLELLLQDVDLGLRLLGLGRLPRLDMFAVEKLEWPVRTDLIWPLPCLRPQSSSCSPVLDRYVSQYDRLRGG